MQERHTFGLGMPGQLEPEELYRRVVYRVLGTLQVLIDASKVDGIRRELRDVQERLVAKCVVAPGLAAVPQAIQTRIRRDAEVSSWHPRAQ